MGKKKSTKKTIDETIKTIDSVIKANQDPSIIKIDQLGPIEKPIKLILKNWQSPGDILMLTAAIKDLHKAHPGKYLVDVRTPSAAFFENSPFITPIDDKDPEAKLIQLDYPLIHQSNTTPHHFIHAFRMRLEEVLGVKIPGTAFKGDIHISRLEKTWINQVHEITGENIPFWIIVNGGKYDFTAKWWNPARNQEIVDYFWGKVTFVQVGEKNHNHPVLERVVDLTGKTDLRQLVRLMYHADGVVCPVTMLMHLAAAVETKEGRPKNRPCVVVAGGREPAQWEAYPHHQYLHTNGALSCCDNGGCWKSRVIPLGDGDSKDASLCIKPTLSENGVMIPKCLDMIRASDVIRSVEKYLEWNK